MTHWLGICPPIRWALATLALLAGPAQALPDGQVLVSVTHNAPGISVFDRLTVTRMPAGSQGPSKSMDLPRQLGGVSTDTQIHQQSLPAGENETADIELKGRPERLPVGRSHLHLFKEM